MVGIVVFQFYLTRHSAESVAFLELKIRFKKRKMDY